MLNRLFSLFLISLVLARIGANEAKEIQYHVIALLNQTQEMAVEVDRVVYTLKLEEPSTILYKGKAPIARTSYRYIKINKQNYRTTAEGFYRSPEYDDTVHESFNRTWNQRKIAPLPQVYEPVSVINRISTNLHREGIIPTIHLVADQNDVDTMHTNYSQKIDVNANMSYASLDDSLFYKKVELSISGRTSRWYNKVSYNIKLSKADRLYGFRRIKLRSLGNDPSYVREQLAYDMLHSLGLPASEFSYCRVFLNNIELGLFGLIEPFQDPWAANEFANGDKDYVSGIMYQGNGHSPTLRYSDLGYMNNLTAYADGQYIIKTGDKDNYEPLQELTEFIQDAPVYGDDVVETWNSKIDMEIFLRSMVLEVLNTYFDGYIGRSHNYYLYKNPDTNNYVYISADLDTTLGFSVSSLKPMMSGNYSTFPGINERPLTAKALEVEEFRKQFDEMILHVTEKLVNPEATNGRIDDLVNMLTEDVAWDQNAPRMGVLIPKFLKYFHITTTNGRVPPGVNIMLLIRLALLSGSPELKPFTSKIPKNPGDFERAIDYVDIVIQGMPFLRAINGPTGHRVCLGVKEFFREMSKNVYKFYYSNH